MIRKKVAWVATNTSVRKMSLKNLLKPYKCIDSESCRIILPVMLSKENFQNAQAELFAVKSPRIRISELEKKENQKLHRTFVLGDKFHSLCKGEARHGGDLNKGKRKIKRPLVPGKLHHLVMRSEKAVGQYNFLRANNRVVVDKIVKKQSLHFGIRIAKFANVGNHLHIALRFKNRASFQGFLISLSGMLARAITHARKGRPFGKFWDALAFTRVLESKMEEFFLREYIQANIIEAQHGPAMRREFQLLQRKRWGRKFRD